jgi:glycerophosphoryl diester phosphodiesterase
MTYAKTLLALSLIVLNASSTRAVANRPDPVINIAHRGASALAPEHTIAAYDLALRQGAHYIEQDIHQTRDGALVVLHDERLDRTARGPREDCSGFVADKTLDQLKRCDVGSWFNSEYPERAKQAYVGLKIPTLDELFERYGGTVNYYIEIKTPLLYPGIEEALLRSLDDHDLTKAAREHRRVLIQSFFPTSLEKVHALDPRLPLIQLYPGIGSGRVQATLDHVSTYAVGIGPTHSDVDQEMVDAAHERCLDVHPYTVDGSRRMNELIDLGVDGMFTNLPRRLAQLSSQNVTVSGSACSAQLALKPASRPA